MTVTEQIMAQGGWSLQLRQDTPREILDLIVPFSVVCVTAGRLALNSYSFPLSGGFATDYTLLGQCRYVGVVEWPGPQTTIGGSGLAMLLGDASGRCFDMGNSAQLPEGDIGFSSTDLSFWLDDITAGSGLRSGGSKTANLFGGPFAFQSTPRSVLDWVADATGCEWRVNNDLTVDLDEYDVLYGTTPGVVITKHGQGREIGYVAAEGDVRVSIDVEDYTSKVIVLGAAGRASSGGASPYYGVDWGQALIVRRVVSDQSIAAGTESTVAASILSLYSGPRREVELTTDLFDVSGEIGVGSLVYLFDQELGLYDTSVTPIQFRGRWIQPLTVRCTGLDWPVRSGMGVYCRYWNATTSAYEWTDLTEFVIPEDGAATIRLGADRRWSDR